MTNAERLKLIGSHRANAEAELQAAVDTACRTGYSFHVDEVRAARANLQGFDYLTTLISTLPDQAFVRGSDCPNHDSLCTADLCILDPKHPGYRDAPLSPSARFI